jgi:hypothetical protein
MPARVLTVLKSTVTAGLEPCVIVRMPVRPATAALAPPVVVVPKAEAEPVPEIVSVSTALSEVTSRLPPLKATVQVAAPPFSEVRTSSRSSVVASTTVWVTVLVPSEIVIP